jgi:Molybdopterin oxidoreductase Fe4S4 domain
MASEVVHTYCPMCVAQCGVIAIVEDGRLTKIKPDPEHPNGGICIKGSAAPEVVYSPDRLRQPMKRTRPKGDPDPGWVQISWEEDGGKRAQNWGFRDTIPSCQEAPTATCSSAIGTSIQSAPPSHTALTRVASQKWLRHVRLWPFATFRWAAE